MKAVILSGGEGTRLRPLTLTRPKPLTSLFDRPVVEHIIGLLARSGITDICLTLRYMSRAIMDALGDGSTLGVSLHYFPETEPLGTAGGVKRCMEVLGEEDFLVISGDAVCDIDLRCVMGFHQTRPSGATLVLHRHSAPVDYGLVLTDQEGRVEGFLEKPAWGEVLTDLVNTGIYILTPQAMAQVPEGKPFDFARDLFPLLLRQGVPLYGFEASGYWCDMGECQAYLRCAADALSGKVSLDLGAPRVRPGVWSLSPIPDDVQVVPPCYIGANVSIGSGSLIGPHAVLEAGSTVGRHSLVQRSVLQGAAVGQDCTLYGAVLCQGASVGDGAVLNEGSVLGQDSSVCRDAILLENVKVWPNRRVSQGTRLTVNLTAGGLREPLRFGDGGVLTGEVGDDLTVQTLHLLGNALGRRGALGLGHCGGSAARMLCHAAGSGASEAGGCVLYTDAPCPSSAAWFAASYSLSAFLFVQQAGSRVFLHFFDSRGLPLDRERERQLEGALLRGEVARMPAKRVGTWEPITGVSGAYAAAAARYASPLARPLTVALPGGEDADRVLGQALELLGCTVVRERRDNTLALRAEHGGMRLRAWDEEGRELPPERLLTLCAMAELQRGVRRLAVPAAAPAAIDLLCSSQGTAVLRLGRDGPEAEELYQARPSLRDAVFAACLLCQRMAQTGERLHVLDRHAPLTSIRRSEVPLRGSRAAVMAALLRAEPAARAAGEGVRFPARDGWVYIAPLSRRSALRVVGEGFEAETAGELCAFYADLARKLDRPESGQ